MKISGFDELNTPKVQVEEPEEYFKKMDISPEQREERVETSKELADVMLFLFALLAIEMQANKPNYPSVLRSFRQRFRDVVSRHSRIDEYVENYINEFTGGVYDNTKRYMEAAGVGVDGRTDAGWWTSVDRATAIGENEANSILNYEELQQALDEGYTTKEWVTERDNRVRPTHKEVDGVTIGISEYFIVGGGMMLAPHDEYNNPEECPNCRFSLRFGNRVNKSYKKVQYTNAESYATLLSDGESLFRTPNDPMREVTGAAIISNPKEVLQFKKEIKASGVEIRQREAGKEAMGYSPGLLPGQPGQFIIDDEASYAAWLHEMKHMRDDRKAGWRGYKASLQNKALRYQMEKDAYAIEIELAKKAGRKDIVKRLRQLLKEERQRIYSDR